MNPKPERANALLSQLCAAHCSDFFYFGVQYGKEVRTLTITTLSLCSAMVIPLSIWRQSTAVEYFHMSRHDGVSLPASWSRRFHATVHTAHLFPYTLSDFYSVSARHVLC